MIEPAKHSQQQMVLYLLALIKFICPFLLQSSVYELHRDEFLYLVEGRHPAWGFMEIPPLLSVFAWITHLFGDGMFLTKCWPSLFGALTYLLVGKTVISLGGRTFALFLAFLPFIAGAFLRTHFLFQPNFLEIFFWTVIAWSMIRFVQTGNNKWLYVFGAGVGLGMMSKYSVAFFTIAILGGLLCTRYKTVFGKKHFYLAMLLAFVIFLPNLLWQYQHGFPVVYHMKELKQTQLQYVSPAGFIIDQFIMHLPVAFIWLTGFCWLLFSKNARPYRMIGFSYLFIMVLLLAGHGKSYYALGVYPILFAFGAYQLEKFTAIRYKALRYILVLAPVALGTMIMPILLPVFEPRKLAAYYADHGIARTGSLKWEDLKDHPLPQDFADMLGWEEMARKTAVAYNRLTSSEKKHTLLFCDSYGQAGALSYYGPKYHLPPAYSANASFLYWMPEQPVFDHLLLITDDSQEMQHSFIKNFKSAMVSDSITNAYAREKGSLIIVLKNADTTFRKFFIDKIKMERAKARW